jgi:hypothetical protein
LPEILEYCELEKCLEREYYYFLLLNPEYNTAKEPDAPMSGRIHSDESLRRYLILRKERRILCLEKSIALKLSLFLTKNVGCS